jgi:carboxylesterase type B
MIIEGMQLLTPGFNSINHWNDLWGVLNSQSQLDWIVLAQNVSDTNVIAQMQNAWDNFVKSGQIWALLIGVFFGYLFRSFTSS